jgi:hypothetical protein
VAKDEWARRHLVVRSRSTRVGEHGSVHMSNATGAASDGPAQKRSRLESGAAEQRNTDNSSGSSAGGNLSRHMSSVVRH